MRTVNKRDNSFVEFPKLNKKDWYVILHLLLINHWNISSLECFPFGSTDTGRWRPDVIVKRMPLVLLLEVDKTPLWIRWVSGPETVFDKLLLYPSRNPFRLSFTALYSEAKYSDLLVGCYLKSVLVTWPLFTSEFGVTNFSPPDVAILPFTWWIAPPFSGFTPLFLLVPIFWGVLPFSVTNLFWVGLIFCCGIWVALLIPIPLLFICLYSVCGLLCASNCCFPNDCKGLTLFCNTVVYCLARC